MKNSELLKMLQGMSPDELNAEATIASSYNSPVLYHMVGHRDPRNDVRNFDTLRAVLRSMEIRANRVADSSGGITMMIDTSRGCIDGEPIAQTVTCFCDIPFEFLALHASKYGVFGIGVDRQVVAEWGGRPVSYIPTVSRNPTAANNHLCREGLSVLEGLQTHFPGRPAERIHVPGTPPATPMEAVDLADDFISSTLAFFKAFNVALPDLHPENFYMEREWRKFGNLSLQLPLLEIVAPADYHTRLREEFPLLRHLAYRAVSVA